MNILLAQATETFFGTISPPPVIAAYGPSGGLIIFMSNLIRLIVIVAGLFSLYNMISAGFQYITSAGDPKATEKTMNVLTMSLLGLILMIAAPAIAAIVGYVLFKDPTFILKPRLTAPPGSATTLLEIVRMYA